MAKIDDSVKKSPELRFAGFTDDWEERKLGEITTSFSGGTPSAGNSSYYKGDIPFIRSGEINSDKTELFLTEAGLKNSSAKMVSVGDILYALYGATSGEVGISQINGAINQAILAIKPCDGYNSHFLMQWLKLQKQKIIDKYLQGGQGNLSGSIVKNLVLNVPSYEEQQKIGVFFKQLDDTIALHQRKLDLLEEQKKGFLQKMFPKNGAKVPELRFAGFTDDWEERKLGDLLNKNSEKNKNLSVINVESVSNKTGFTKQTDQFKDYSVASVDLSNYYVIREKQFAYNPSRINVGSIAYKDLGDEISVVSPLYVSFSTKKVLNDGFLWNWFKTASFDAQRQRLSEGGVRDTLSFNQLSEMNIMFPTYPEQEKIGSFFKQLDDTIALHQRKLDLLKEQKKGFLQKMFV